MRRILPALPLAFSIALLLSSCGIQTEKSPAPAKPVAAEQTAEPEAAKKPAEPAGLPEALLPVEPTGRSIRITAVDTSTEKPLSVGVERDIVYATAGKRDLHLDLYLPVRESTVAPLPLPVVVWIHGGGWQAGNKNNPRARFLADRNYAVASIEYRLSGEAIWPAQIHDCKAAIRFLRANAEKYNLAPHRIGVWGSSAGGHLVALLGTSGGVTEVEGTLGNLEESSRVQAVCDYFGPSDLTTMSDIGEENHPAGPLVKLFGGSVQDNLDAAKQAGPVTWISKDDPPFLIVHGGYDLLVPVTQSVNLHGLLTEAGVESTLYIVKGGGHGVFPLEENENIRKMVSDFFNLHLKK